MGLCGPPGDELTAPSLRSSKRGTALRADPGKRSDARSIRHLGLPERRAKLAAKSWGYDEMAHDLSAAYQKIRPGKTMLCWPMWGSGFMPWPIPGPLAADGVHPSALGSRIASGDHCSRDPTAQGGAAMTAETKSRRHLSRGTAGPGSGSHHGLHRPAARMKEL